MIFFSDFLNSEDANPVYPTQNALNSDLSNKPELITKVETKHVENGICTYASIAPEFLFFEKHSAFVEDSNGKSDFIALPPDDALLMVFNLKDKTKNYTQPLYTPDTQDKSTTFGRIKNKLTSVNGYSNVLYNSDNNMIPINFRTHYKLNVATYVDFVSMTEFSDTGNFFFSINLVAWAYNEKTDSLFKQKDDRYCLKIRKNGQTSLIKNNRLCTSNSSIRVFFYYIRDSWLSEDSTPHEFQAFKNELEKQFLKYHGINIELNQFECSDLASIYRAIRNKNLSQLPWNYSGLCYIYTVPTDSMGDRNVAQKEIQLARNKINYHLRKGNTKKATDACFYGFTYPKSVRKALLKSNPLQYRKDSYRLLSEVCDTYGPNNALSLLHDKDGHLNFSALKKPHYLRAYLFGFSYNSVYDHLYRVTSRLSRSTVPDTIRMIDALKEHGVAFDIKTSNISRFHDEISKIYTLFTQKQKGAEADCYATVDTSEQSPSMFVDGYHVRSPKTAGELVQVGLDMGHCVASYMSSFFHENLDIVLVEKDSKYLACLEMLNNKVVQAKLSRNRPLSENKALMQVVEKWASANDIELCSLDCGTSVQTLEAYKQRGVDIYKFNKPSEERMRILKDKASAITQKSHPVAPSGLSFLDDSVPF